MHPTHSELVEMYRQYVIKDYNARSGDPPVTTLPHYIADDLWNDSCTKSSFLEDNELPEDYEL